MLGIGSKGEEEMDERRKRNIAVAYDRRRAQHTYVPTQEDDDNLLETVLAAETVTLAMDSLISDPSPSIDTSVSSDFGGFDGGSSGGGGSSSDW